MASPYPFLKLPQFPSSGTPVPAGSQFDAVLKFQGPVPQEASALIKDDLSRKGYDAEPTINGSTVTVRMATRQPKTAGEIAGDVGDLIAKLIERWYLILVALVAFSFFKSGGLGPLGHLLDQLGAAASDVVKAADSVTTQVRELTGAGSSIGTGVTIAGAALVGFVVLSIARRRF